LVFKKVALAFYDVSPENLAIQIIAIKAKKNILFPLRMGELILSYEEEKN